MTCLAPHAPLGLTIFNYSIQLCIFSQCCQGLALILMQIIITTICIWQMFHLASFERGRCHGSTGTKITRSFLSHDDNVRMHCAMTIHGFMTNVYSYNKCCEACCSGEYMFEQLLENQRCPCQRAMCCNMNNVLILLCCMTTSLHVWLQQSFSPWTSILNPTV